MDADLTSGLILQIPDELDQSTVDHSCVGPLPLERCGGRDVLRDPVDERRERLDLAARPELSPLVVAAAAEDDRVLGRDDGGEVDLHRVIPVGEEPIGALGDAVEGQQLVDDDLAHARQDHGDSSCCGRSSRISCQEAFEPTYM